MGRCGGAFVREIRADAKLVAYCGLYCGACRKYLKEKCPGCHQNEKATWCTVRSCCMEKKIASCAECTEFPDPRGCKKFNNSFSKLMGLVFRSDRPACIACLKEMGPVAYAAQMALAKRQAIRR